MMPPRGPDTLPASQMRLTLPVATLFAVAVIHPLLGSCLLELDHEIACGDGYVDSVAGEECDPAKPSSYVDRCAGTSRPDGEASCDPVSCTIVNDKAQCAACGDQAVDNEFGEECDGANLNGRRCPGGEEGLQCGSECKFDYSECEPCGNGVREEGEECDPSAMGGLVIPRACAGAGELPPLEPLGKPYTSGDTVRCNDDCRYDRTQCGFCGDGTRDVMEYVDFGILAPTEWCDGDNFDEQRIIEEYGTCADDGARPNVGCAAGCRGFVDRTDVAQCCLRKGATCPAVGDTIRCCAEYDHPEEEPCEEFFEGMTIRRVCK
jgi:hypothetical protein